MEEINYEECCNHHRLTNACHVPRKAITEEDEEGKVIETPEASSGGSQRPLHVAGSALWKSRCRGIAP